MSLFTRLCKLIRSKTEPIASAMQTFLEIPKRVFMFEGYFAATMLKACGIAAAAGGCAILQVCVFTFQRSFQGTMFKARGIAAAAGCCALTRINYERTNRNG